MFFRIRKITYAPSVRLVFLLTASAGCRSKAGRIISDCRKRILRLQNEYISDGLQGRSEEVATIMVVDDRAGIRKLPQEVLQSAGYDVLTAAAVTKRWL